MEIASVISHKLEAKRYTACLHRFVEEVIGLKNAPFHNEIYSLLEDPTIERLLILAPRNSGKSTAVSVCYPLWLLCRDKSIRIIIVANTISQAREWLRQIEQHLLYNEKLRQLFGNMVPDVRKKGAPIWTDTEKEILGRPPFATHLSLLAVGFGGAILGRRCDVLIVDDLIDYELTISEVGRERVRAWFFETLIPVLEPGGKLCVVATRWHERDLYGELIRIWQKEGAVRIYKAIQDNGEPLWPERWPLERLEQMRRTMGSLFFNCQFMNEPIPESAQIFKASWVRIASSLPESLSIFQGIDPSLSGEPTANYFAIVTIGLSADNKVYILDLVRTRASFRDQLELIKAAATKWNPLVIHVESNAAQRFLAEAPELAHLPIRGSPTQLPRESRFLTLATLMETGRLLWRGEGGELASELAPLRDEMLLFPACQHDDALNALQKAVEIALKPTAPAVAVSLAPEVDWYPELVRRVPRLPIVW